VGYNEANSEGHVYRMKKFHRNDLKYIYHAKHKKYYTEKEYIAVVRKGKIVEILEGYEEQDPKAL
jgi:hypothetical protein